MSLPGTEAPHQQAMDTSRAERVVFGPVVDEQDSHASRRAGQYRPLDDRSGSVSV
jgi:hypothetical protein